MRAAKLAVRAAAVCACVVSAGAQSVVINEIHYNPPGSGDPQEFVELYNNTGAAIDISNWHLGDFATPGCTFAAGTSIPAGGFVVAAKDPNALFLATGYWTPHHWDPDDSLSNEGETVTLRDAGATIVDTVTYGVVAPWPTGLGGRSLELVNPALDNSSPTAWRASAAVHGTPGAQNSVFTAGPVVVGETPQRMTAVDALASVTVVFSTDVTGVDAADLLVAGSPATAVSPPTGPARTYTFAGFASPSPGSVAINLLAGGITGEGGVPFAGDAWTVSVGQVIVINEIHYHPPDPYGDAEFLELHNPGASTVPMAGWRISDGVELTFSAGTSIPPGGFLVIALNPAMLQQVTGYSGATAWTSGRLDNGGERVALSDAANNLIDELVYVDKGSWPQAPDGHGPTLELINPRVRNEFGASWRASVANYGTPGAVNSQYQPLVAPIIVNVQHTPVIPSPSQSVTVTAVVFDDQPNPTVTLHYRQDQDPTIAYSSVPMLDDGLSGDGAAGDGVYGATMPGLADGQRLDFTIRASDGVNMAAAPSGHDTLNAGEYPAQTYLCPFVAQHPGTDFPGYYLITTQHVRNQQDAHVETEFDATFVRRRADGTYELFYNVIEHYRGQSSLNQHPHSFHVKFAEDHPLASEMGFTLTRLILNSQTIVRQHLGNKYFREAFGGAIPAPYTQFVRLYTSPLTHGGAQNYIYINVERLDGDYLKTQGGDLPQPLRFPDRCTGSATVCNTDTDCGTGHTCVPVDEGNLYRGRHNDAHLRWEGPDPSAYMVDASGMNGYELENNEDNHDWTDLLTLCYALDSATTPDGSVTQETYEDAVAAVADTVEWARWFAIHMLIMNWEGGIYRDTGDDYYLYFRPTGAPGGYSATLLSWDMDSVFGGWNNTFAQDSIWRTTVPSPQRFIRSNAFCGRFIGAINDMLNNEFTRAHLDPIIDAIPDQVFVQERQVLGYGSGYTKQAFKDWISARITNVNSEIRRTLTLTGVPSSPYANPNSVIALSGQLNQVGTRRVVINGTTVDAYNVYNATWSHAYTLRRGLNEIVVQCLDHNGVELSRQSAIVRYDPPPASIRLTMPTRMVNTRTLTLKAELLDSFGNIDWRIWNRLGTVSATRGGQPVPTSITVFETNPAGAGSTSPADSIRCYNGVGSVSITLDNGAAEPEGDILVTVTVDGVSASKTVTVLADTPGLYQNLSGTLSGGNLTWEPADGVIHLTGDVTVPSGQTLSILPGTLIMVDAGPEGDGTAITATNATIQAIGQQANPIFFFPTNGPVAMVLPQSQKNNPPSWGGVDLGGSGSSTFAYMFLTGAGNNPITGHPRPAVFHLANSHSVTMTDCVFADSPGKIVHGAGTGYYLFQRCLFSRNGIGGEFLNGGYHATFEDTWFTRIGRALESADCDGDVLHIDYPSQSMLRRCILTDCGDDMVDHSNGATPTFENCIIYDGRDKVVSIGGGGNVTMTNCLVFEAPGGIRCSGVPVYLTHVTLGPGTSVIGPGGTSQIQNSILWTNSVYTCTGDVDYTLVGNSGDLGCGTGNFSADPLFLDSSFSPPGDLFVDFNLRFDSPALGAGPTGNRIGWLGFPTAETCLVDADCVDTDVCTQDTCVAGVCSHTAIPNCCHTDDDCDDGLYCNGEETCGGDHFCDAGTPIDCGTDVCDEATDRCVECLSNADCNDGDACTTDTCSNNECSSTPVVCDDGNPCTDDACNSATGCVHTNNTNPCDDGLACTSNDACSGGACVGVDSCPAGQSCDHGTGQCVFEPQTLVFRNGLNGYTGTVDTYINLNTPNANNGALDVLRWDTQESSGDTPMYTLVRFDNLFAGYGGPIPAGAQILAATLSYTVGGDNATGDTGDLREALVDWDAATTYNTFGGDAGVQFDEYGGTSIASMPAAAMTTYDVNVLPSVQAWCANPALNRGWIVLPTGADGVRVRSGEYATVGERPALTIQYVSGCNSDAECDDDNVCNGEETCVASQCVAGTPLDCDDGNPCTTDTCDPILGCQHSNAADGTPCADADLCDGTETCQSGVCTAGTPLVCDDGNVCTDDSCVPATGCVYTNNTSPCDDGIACTGNDACSNGACTGEDTCADGMTCNHATGFCESSSPAFIAYNDCVYANVAQQTDPEGVLVPYKAANVTTYNIGAGSPGPASGMLVDQATGAATGVTVTLTQNGTVNWNHTIGGTWSGGYTTHAGTDARLTFGGIADITGVIYYGSTGWWVDATFTGLDPQKRYTFATSAARSEPTYTTRETRFSLSGVVSATNASTPGVSVYNNNPLQVYFNTGDNHTTGYVARWTDIDPGADGSFTVRAQAHNINQAYAFSVFMLEEQGGTPGCTSNADCDDGFWCNGAETCNIGTGVCQPGTPPDCSDAFACTTDACDEATDSCIHTPNHAACNDGAFCNGVEVCDPAQGCVSGPSPCEADEACSEADDACVDPPVVAAIGSRYIEVTPPAGVSALALEVSSAGVPCLPRYVSATGRLVATPVFRSSAEWGRVRVADEELIPDTTYAVRVGVGTPLDLTAAASARTWLWGDAGNDGGVDVLDIICVLDGFENTFGQCSRYGDDLQGDVPNGVINILDITAVLDAFSGLPYPDADPCDERAAERSQESVVLTLVPRRATIRPNDVLAVDVFASAASDLRGYEIAPARSCSLLGGGLGARESGRKAPLSEPSPSHAPQTLLRLESVAVEVARADYIFAGLTQFAVTDPLEQRLAAAALEGGVPVVKSRYLGTFTLRATSAAAGTYPLGLRLEGTILLDSYGRRLHVELLPASITVAPY